MMNRTLLGVMVVIDRRRHQYDRMVAILRVMLMEFADCFLSVSYTIPPENVPANWLIESEECGDEDSDIEANNLYEHEYLDVTLHLHGQQMESGPDAPVIYDITIMAREGMGQVDYWLETDEEIIEFETARNYAIALMVWMEKASQSREEEYVREALYRVNSEQHHGPIGSTTWEDSEWNCSVCGMNTEIYRGWSYHESYQHHLDHMTDDEHEEWELSKKRREESP